MANKSNRDNKKPKSEGRIIKKMPADARRNIAKLERGKGISPAKKGLRAKDKPVYGWISEPTLRRRLAGFINSEMGIDGASPKEIRKELKFAAAEMKRQFPKGSEAN